MEMEIFQFFEYIQKRDCERAPENHADRQPAAIWRRAGCLR